MQKSLRGFCTGKRMPWRGLSLLLLMLPAARLKAQSYRSLTDKVNLQMGKTNAASVIRLLQQQTPYVFVYDPEYLHQCLLPEVKFADAPLNSVLQYLDNNAPLDIELTNTTTIAVRKGHAEKPAVRVNGRITGKVVDNKNEPLPGVTIQVQGGNGAVTNVDGTYELLLEPGKYTINFSYISYASRQVTDVEVTEKGVTPLNIALKSSGSHLKGVTVTGSYKKASVEGLYAIQKNNAAITDGISAEQIARTPDKNLGEVLKRVSGLATVESKYVVVRGLSERYNQAILNGQVMPSTELNRKNFNFEIIPSSLIDNVTVIKTLTPDRSAEFGGGLVEVNTIDIPTNDFLNISVGGSYNDKTTGKSFLSLPLEGREYRGQIATHRYWMGDDNWKSATDLHTAYNNSYKDKAPFANNWILTDMRAPVSPNFQVSGGKLLDRKFGVVAAASYRNTFATQDIVNGRDGFSPLAGTPENLSRLFKGQRYGFTTNLSGLLGVGFRDEKNRVSFQTLYLRTLDQQLLVGTGPSDFAPHTLEVQDITTQSTLLQNQLRGEHSLGKHGVKLKWMGSYIRMDKLKPDNHMLLGDAVKDTTAAINEYNIIGSQLTSLAGTLRWWSRAVENNYNWDISLSAPFKINKLDNTVKVGYAGWNKERTFFVVNTGSNPGTPPPNYLPLQEYFSEKNGVKTQMTDDGDGFKSNTTLNAMYLMLDHKIGRFRLVWGGRAEYYNLNEINSNLENTFKNFTSNPNAGYDFNELKNREPNWRFFPSANFTYSLTPSMNLRLAYAESIVRPDVRELSYFREYDYELGGDYMSGLVRSTTIKHYDFRYEWYPAPGEIISASLFYKNMAYPMEIYKIQDNRIYKLQNNKDAKNYGVELEVRKSLAFTQVPVLRNLTLYGNFSYLDGKVRPMRVEVKQDSLNPKKIRVTEEIGDAQKRPQSGASNYMLNAGAYYDVKRFSVSLVYNYVANRMFRPEDAYFYSLFEQPLRSLDGQIAVRFLKNKAELRMNVSNILNAYAIIYSNTFNDDPDVLAHKKDPTKKDLLYQSDKDRLDFRSAPGRTYSATFSYRF